MGLLTPLAIRIGAISWMPKLLPQIVWTDRRLQKVTRGRVSVLDIAGLPNLTLTVVGPAGDSVLGFGLLDGVSPFLPYGMLLAGQNVGTSVLALLPNLIPVGTPITLPVPANPGLVGLAAGLLAIAFPTGNLAVGNFTRLYRFLIRQ